MNTKEYSRHYEQSAIVKANPENVFAYADDHANFSSHMNQSSWMMGGGSMKTETDEGKGQKLGSHIRMNGKILGVELSLDEVIVEHDPPYHKAWETVGDVNLIVIDHYKLGFYIKPVSEKSDLTVFIDYNLPQSRRARWLGQLFGGMYARWCVGQMVNDTKKHFNSPTNISS